MRKNGVKSVPAVFGTKWVSQNLYLDGSMVDENLSSLESIFAPENNPLTPSFSTPQNVDLLPVENGIYTLSTTLFTTTTNLNTYLGIIV